MPTSALGAGPTVKGIIPLLFIRLHEYASLKTTVQSVCGVKALKIQSCLFSVSQEHGSKANGPNAMLLKSPPAPNYLAYHYRCGRWIHIIVRILYYITHLLDVLSDKAAIWVNVYRLQPDFSVNKKGNHILSLGLLGYERTRHHWWLSKFWLSIFCIWSNDH